jgi:hypothetical protein
MLDAATLARQIESQREVLKRDAERHERAADDDQ